MYKKLFSVLLIPVLVLSAKIEKSYVFTTPQIVGGKICMDDCSIAESDFAPSVAVHAVQLLLPKGHTAVSYTVHYGESEMLPGNYYVKPAIPPTPKSHGKPPEATRSKSAVYQENAFFPAQRRSKSDFNVQYKNGCPIFCAMIHPTQYNPVTRQVRYFKEVSISVETVQSRSASYYCTPSVRDAVRATVENKEAVGNLPLSVAGPEDYEYLIVCRTDFQNSFADFTNFNKRRGLRTKVATVDFIKSQSGADFQEKLRNYITKEYKERHIQYVALASNDWKDDTKSIPHRGFWAKYYDHDVKQSTLHEDNDIPADMYYGCLDGTWKKPNGIYGEYGAEDIPAEVYVGRFHVENQAQLTNLLNKVMKYSEQPVKNAINNVMLAGEFLWDDYNVKCTGSKCLDNLKHEKTSEHGFETYGFSPDKWSFFEVRHEDNEKWERNRSVRNSLFFEAISKNKCSWVDHNGHASTDFSIGNIASSGSQFNEDWTDVLSDDTWKGCDGVSANYFFFTSGGCYSGSLDRKNPESSGLTDYAKSDSWAAVASRLETGPVALIANARYGMGDNDGTDGGSDRPIRWIHDAMFNPAKKFHYAGMMLAKAKESDMARITMAHVPDKDIKKDSPYWGVLKYTNYELNLYGDPALSLWTTNPADLSLDPKITGTTFTVDTKGPHSWVALLDKDDKIFITQQTGIDGKCSISDPLLTQYLAANVGSKLKVNVKSHNFLPASASITINATSVLDRLNAPSANFALVGSRNPRLDFTLTTPGLVNVALYDMQGALVQKLRNDKMEAGSHSVDLVSSGLCSGVYYCKVACNDRRSVLKFQVVR